VDKLIVQYFSI